MLALSETLKKEIGQAIKKALETGEKEVALEGGFFLTTEKEQPNEIGFFSQIEEGGKTFYVCQKL